MQKDFKIGIVLGLVMVAAVAVWLSTRPALTVKSRTLSSYEAAAPRQSSTEQPRFVTDLPNASYDRQGAATETERNNPPESIIHTVRSGETLSAISRRYYGSENKWQKIFDANREKIKDQNKLKLGTKLIIPK